jgi:hypothetical protein
VIPKNVPFRSKRWLQAVASLDCQICGASMRTQAAHRNQGKGMGTKTDDCLTAALCFECHQEIDQGTKYTREERRSMMDDAILKTIVRLAQDGWIQV